MLQATPPDVKDLLDAIGIRAEHHEELLNALSAEPENPTSLAFRTQAEGVGYLMTTYAYDDLGQ